MTDHSVAESKSQKLSLCQKQALGILLPLVYSSNPFYSSKLKTATTSLDWTAFCGVPLTLKSELVADQQQNPPFGSNMTYARPAYTRVSHTSGTSSAPLYWVDTEESWSWMVANWLRVYQAADVTANDSVFFAFSFGPFLGFWTGFDAAAALGALVVPGGGLTSLARLQKLIDLQATVLCCTPSYAVRLALAAKEDGIDLTRAKVSRIIVAGECGGSMSSTRLRIQNLWNGARVVDHYGMTEVGPAGYGCPCCPDLLHIINDSYISEVIDPATGLPVASGSPGELVLTPLGRLGSPVLRYRTGDVVQSSARGRCACGSSDIGLEGGILGRSDDMLIVRGMNVYPSAVERILFSYGILNYRVDVFEQKGMPELHIQVEGAEGHLGGRLDELLHASFGLHVELSYINPGHLPYSDGKGKTWIRHY